MNTTLTFRKESLQKLSASGGSMGGGAQARHGLRGGAAGHDHAPTSITITTSITLTDTVGRD